MNLSYLTSLPLLASLALASCATSHLPAEMKPDRGTRAVTEQQRLSVTRVELHAQNMGYKAPPNKPDTHSSILVYGKPAAAGQASLWDIKFYAAGDSRLRAPYYDSRTGRFTVFQDIATLPAWLGCLTKIAVNEAIVLNYFCWDDDRYELETSRLITSK